MPEESESNELDLSNLDSLLKDMEKDLAPDAAEDALELTDEEPAERVTKPVAAPPPAATVASPATAPAPVAVADDDRLPPHDEILASPVRPHEKDEPPDQHEDMFTEEEEPPERIPHETDAAELAPEPAPAPEPPAVEISFEDALDVLAEEFPPVPPAAPMALPEPQLPNPTPELFTTALRAKKYDQAVQIGKSLLAPDSTPAFRMNLAGAMFYAGLRNEAEQELASLLKQNPYHIPARRNLEFVQAGR